jgi:histidyl-tRNA synthetase
MKVLISAPKGTRDILPGESKRWHHIEGMALAVAERYGFFELRTPTFEHTELFVRSVGDTTDVVQKEMYTFHDKKDRSITLRPEGTAGVVRAAIENNLFSNQLPLKTSYVTNCFRYEKPQAGRLREFHQFGVESLGSDSPAADAEVIALASHILRSLGATRLKLFINSIGCPTCRPLYQSKLVEYMSAHRDCKITKCKNIAADAPKMIDHLCKECQSHFEQLRSRLEAMDIAYIIDPDIVRGLDYYVRTVFEFVTDTIGAQGTVCGGGRYDGLVELLGGPSMPGVGFAMGLERLLLVLEASGAQFPPLRPCDIYIAPIGEKASLQAGLLIEKLRNAGAAADSDLMGRSVKAQMRYADRIKARYTLVIGDDEIQKRQGKIKNMADGTEQVVSLDEDFVDAVCLLIKCVNTKQNQPQANGEKHKGAADCQ